jgi:hypothetical protein
MRGREVGVVCEGEKIESRRGKKESGVSVRGREKRELLIHEESGSDTN